MTTSRVKVKGEILRWAREAVRLTLPEASKRLGIEESRLKHWEATEGDPTTRQLEEMGRAYRRCIDVFFMSTPPKEPPAPIDFRSHFGHGFRRRLTYLTIVAIREARQVQELYGDLRRELGTGPELSLPRLKLPADAEATAARMRKFFNVPLEEQCEWSNEYRALREWRRALEGMGILVVQPVMPREEVRAFSLSGETPVIALNGSDFPTARIFSMFHEWVHLALSEPGLCNPDGTFAASDKSNQIELFCNSVAGRFLVPTSALASHDAVTKYQRRDLDLLSVLGAIADSFNVSRAVVLWRLFEMGLIGKGAFDDMRRRLAMHAAALRRARRKKRKSKGIRIRPAKITVKRFGPTFVSSVIQARASGIISFHEMAGYLRTKVDRLDSLNIELGSA